MKKSTSGAQHQICKEENKQIENDQSRLSGMRNRKTGRKKSLRDLWYSNLMKTIKLHIQ